MSNWPEGPPRRGGRRQEDDLDAEQTQVLRDEYDHFYGPRRPQGRPPHPQERQPHPRQRPPGPPPYRRPPGGPPPRPPRKRGSWQRKLLAILGIIVLLLAGLYVYVDSQLNKVNALPDYEGRPAATAGQTWLLVGSDSRQGLSKAERQRLHTGQASGQRTDTIMVMHIPRFGGKPTLISLPRDSLVDIPAHTDDGEGVPAQQGKLNWAYSFGGPRLLAKTIEQETGMRIDDYMEVGFGGFVNVVQAVGGVNMCIKQPIHDEKSGADFSAGCQELNGPESLSYVRARYFDPEGDLGRVQRQRQFVRALIGEVASPATLLNPVAMTRVINGGLGSLKVDKSTGPFDLLWFGWHMKGLTSGDGSTITVPVQGTTSMGDLGSVVVWDKEKALALFRAIKEDEPVPPSIIKENKQ